MNRNLCAKAAIGYIRANYSIIPVDTKTKKPLVPWTEFQIKAATEAQVVKWWRQWPDARIAGVCGYGGFVVIDVDESKWTPWVTEDFQDVTPLDATPRGGVHIRLVESRPSGCAAFLPGQVDIKGMGGLSLLPPSEGYRRINGHRKVLRVPNAREWMTAQLKRHGVEVPERKKLAVPIPERIEERTRNDTLASMAGTMRRRGIGQEAILAALLEENNLKCKPPLPDEEVRQIAASISRYQPAETTAPTPTDAAPLHRTDLGNARRYVRAHGQDLRFCKKWGKWLVWDATRWTEDDLAEVARRAKDVPRIILAEAVATDDDALRESLAKWAIATESASKQGALLLLARSELGVPILPASLDADPCLFNITNGTLNLCTGELQPHRQEDYITKIAPVVFDSKATCSGFLKALREIFADNEAVIGYVQRSLGRALTGDVSEQQIDIWYGSGDNGKSFLLELMLKLQGDYGLMAPPGLLLASHGERHPAELATLKGVRLAVSMEVGEGNRLNEERVKQLTGTDRVTARRMREDFWTYEPTHHLFLATNHRPTIRGSDLAIWKRIRLVPFTVTIPPEKQDKRLGERLWRDEASGILNWLVKGCLDWLKDGLRPPDAVTAATADYRGEMDVLADFLAEECELDANEIMPFSLLYEAYSEWAKKSGMRPLTATAFGLKLGEKGFPKTATRDGKRARQGLKLALGTLPGPGEDGL